MAKNMKKEQLMSLFIHTLYSPEVAEEGNVELNNLSTKQKKAGKKRYIIA